MSQWRTWLRSRGFVCALWVALCFGLTSCVYLSWVGRLVRLTGGCATDWLSMVAGYLMQAGGMGAAVFALRRDPEVDFRQGLYIALALFAAVSAPTLLTDSPAAAACFGLVMNLLCGYIAAGYLLSVASSVEAPHRSLAFGGGYALSTVAVGLISLIGGGNFLNGKYSLLLFLPLAAAAALIPARIDLFSREEPSSEPEPLPPRELALALCVVALISAVKNLGFSFPSSDIEAGLNPALSRLPYAIGLAAAGWISDRSRRGGMLCTVAALILPFLMLGLTSEPVPAAICWGLDYLFYGFFSVFRAVLFLDIACRCRRTELAPAGLLAGRVGDAMGTAVGLLLSESRLALIAVTAALFFPAVFLFFRLYQKRYEPKAAEQRNEQEVFEAFCLHNDLSQREREVLRMILSEHTNGEIAEALFITESTVKYHVRNVLQKTGCKNRGELQRKYISMLYPHLGAAETIPERSR